MVLKYNYVIDTIFRVVQEITGVAFLISRLPNLYVNNSMKSGIAIESTQAFIYKKKFKSYFYRY